MKYLLTFAQRHTNFRLPELDAILTMNNLDKSQVYSEEDYNQYLPYLVVNFEKEEDAVNVCSRGILIKSMMELYIDSNSYEKLEKDIEKMLSDNVLSPYVEDASWSITVGAFGKSLSLQRQSEIRNFFKNIPLKGEVKCKDPDQSFWCVEQHVPEIPGVPIKADSSPQRIYFGREVARSDRRNLLKSCDLKKRSYLGPTSMDNELSLVMANMGLVRKNSMVLDPFVGTGSILVACANFGAFCFGTDIDTRVLKGKDGSNLFSNFDQYNLPRPEIVRCDASMYGRQFHHSCIYDAIVCDPPYGIRAGARKSGSKKDTFRVVPDECRTVHIPQTQPYPVEDVLTDLLDLSAQSLKLKGRLVFLLPTTYDFTEEDLPKHPCLKVVANSEQPLNQKYGRRLLTMEKVADFDETQKAVYTTVASASASRPFSQIREKMMGDGLVGSLDKREAKRRKAAAEDEG